MNDVRRKRIKSIISQFLDLQVDVKGLEAAERAANATTVAGKQKRTKLEIAVDHLENASLEIGDAIESLTKAMK